jgi:hypothetical protein
VASSLTGTSNGDELCVETHVPVGSPHKSHIGYSADVPVGLKLIEAVLGGMPSPIALCGDRGIGEYALQGGVPEIVFDETAVDRAPDGTLTVYRPPPAVTSGVIAYGCDPNCSYLITGDLGADVIVWKDQANQLQIIRVTARDPAVPLTGVSHACRCCGKYLPRTKLRAKILAIEPPGGPYEVCDEFVVDPIIEGCDSAQNPLQISITCSPTPSSVLEDPADWTAFAGGMSATVLSIGCCTGPTGCSAGTSTATATATSTSDTGTSTACRFEAVIQSALIDGHSYTLLLWFDPENPCESGPDINIGDPVIAHACGFDMDVGDRVIVLKIPAGFAPDGCALVNWFVVRHCSTESCTDSCDPEPVGPPCCGTLCSAMPDNLTLIIEAVGPNTCGCTEPVVLNLVKSGGTLCDSAADTKWVLDPTLAGPPLGEICQGTLPDPPFFPIWLDITSVEVTCGTVEASCAEHSGTGTGTGTSENSDGPVFNMNVYTTTGGGPGVGGSYMPNQDRKVSCCDTLYAEFHQADGICMAAGAGIAPNPTALKYTIFAA